MRVREKRDDREKRRRILRRLLICVSLTLACNWLAYYGTRYLTAGRNHLDMTGAIERKIPLLTGSIFIYWGCYLYWIVNYFLGGLQEAREVYRFFAADFLAKLVCLFTFLLLPTTNVRPVIEGEGLTRDLMRLLYEVDAPDNLFPSIHCLTSWFCLIAVRGQKRVPAWYKECSFLATAAICLSTLTTKQHVIWDVIGGILLAEGSFYLVRKTGFERGYGKAVKYIEKIIEKIIVPKIESADNPRLSDRDRARRQNADGAKI